jgi:ribosomal protein S18 acetylase RimI-like enzyme
MAPSRRPSVTILAGKKRLWFWQRNGNPTLLGLPSQKSLEHRRRQHRDQNLAPNQTELPMTERPQKEITIRAATPADLGWVHETLMSAIAEADVYNDTFKAWETQRMSPQFLSHLHGLDPWFIRIAMVGDERAGLQISGPDCGALFLYWSYIKPEHRVSGLAQKLLKTYRTHFDNGYWHKLATLARANNRVAILLMRRHGWRQVAELNNHIFGQDYLMFEIMLEKTRPGYQFGFAKGRAGRLKDRLDQMLGRT